MVNFFWNYLTKREEYFYLTKTQMQTPLYNLTIFNKTEAQFMLMLNKAQQHTLIEFSCYQHPTKKIIPFILLFDTYKSRYIQYFCFYPNSLSNKKIFPSFSWLEREVFEFFGYKITNLVDSRNLLLDYNKNYNALLKTFPTSGFEEVYYDPFFDRVVFKKINFIEL